MACCLAIAAVFAVWRRIVGARSPATLFAPPAYRGPSDQPRPDAAPASSVARPPLVRHDLLLGVLLGATVYLVDITTLGAAGAIDTTSAVRGLGAVVGALAVSLLLARGGTPSRSDALFAVAVAGLTFGVLGLVEMHVLGSITYVGRLVWVDLLFHATGPAVAAAALVARSRALRPAL